MKTEMLGKIRVKCVPSDCNKALYTVIVRNSQNETVYEGNTSKNGIAEFTVDTPDEYEIKVKAKKYLSPRAACRWVTLRPKEEGTLYFIFSPRNTSHYIVKSTFSLTDLKYNGLPISNGEMHLWQVPM